jgi:hypothetical protein
VVLALVLVVGLTRPVAAQFTIDDLEIHLTPQAGEPLTRLIPIRSEIDAVQQVRIVVKDWVRDSLGGNVMSDYGSFGSSCGERLQVFPLTLQLGARATEFIRVSYSPTVASDPGCWAIVLSETVRPPQPPSPAGGASVTITTLIGVKVYVHAPDAKADGAILSADVEEFWERHERVGQPIDSTFVRQLAVRFESTGTAHLRVKSSVEIRDESTQVVAQLVGPEAYMTPGAYRDILVRLPSLKGGRYVAVVLLDYGADEITAAQIEFEVP